MDQTENNYEQHDAALDPSAGLSTRTIPAGCAGCALGNLLAVYGSNCKSNNVVYVRISQHISKKHNQKAQTRECRHENSIFR